MNDSIDIKLYQYFADMNIPNERLDNIIESAILAESQPRKIKHSQYILKVASICIIFILTGSIVFAKEIANYIIELFADTHLGIERAIENGYISKTDMEYLYSDDIEFKVNSIIMDDFYLMTTFTVKLNKNIDNIYDIKIPDLIISDEDNNIIFCDYDNVEGYEKFCEDNDISYSKMNMHNNYTNNGYSIEILRKHNGEILFAYKMYSTKYPKSKVLTFNFKNIDFKENGSSENAEFTKNVTCNIKVDVPEEFFNREMVCYEVEDGSAQENNIKVKSVIVGYTETEVNFEGTWGGIKTKGEITEEKEDNLIKSLLEKNIFFDDIVIENEKGKIFKKTQVSDSGGIIYSPDGFARGTYYFTMTQYDMTDKMKLKMYRENQEFIINLIKK